MSLENNNPYNDFLTLMRDEGQFYNPTMPVLGTVFSPLPDIAVGTQGITLDKDDLLIDKWILDRHNEEFWDHTEGEHAHGDATGPGIHKHEMKEPLTNKIEVGDLLLLIPYGEKFVIVSKVVNL